jgi:hypothetical protein
MFRMQKLILRRSIARLCARYRIHEIHPNGLHDSSMVDAVGESRLQTEAARVRKHPCR